LLLNWKVSSTSLMSFSGVQDSRCTSLLLHIIRVGRCCCCCRCRHYGFVFEEKRRRRAVTASGNRRTWRKVPPVHEGFTFTLKILFSAAGFTLEFHCSY
jgi:hypothetical protein